MHGTHSDVHTFQCSQCDLAFMAKHGLHMHEGTCHLPKRFGCQCCDFTAVLCFKLKLHVHTHLAKKLQCEVCGQSVSTREALQAHTLLHLDHSWRKCQFCDRKFASSLSLMTHEIGQHGEGYHCTSCSKVFTSPAQCSRHG